jgi:hypothetical protein
MVPPLGDGERGWVGEGGATIGWAVLSVGSRAGRPATRCGGVGLAIGTAAGGAAWVFGTGLILGGDGASVSMARIASGGGCGDGG